jgi:hypothetical protein
MADQLAAQRPAAGKWGEPQPAADRSAVSWSAELRLAPDPRAPLEAAAEEPLAA